MVQRERAVDLFELGFSHRVVAPKLGVPRSRVRALYQRWQLQGRLCLVRKTTKLRYSFEFKKQVVERLLAGETHLDLCRELSLNCVELTKGWLRLYRDGGDEALMSKRKKTASEGSGFFTDPAF